MAPRGEYLSNETSEEDDECTTRFIIIVMATIMIFQLQILVFYTDLENFRASLYKYDKQLFY